MNIQDIMRLSHVKRWHIVHTTREQSVAEHTFNVTMIAREIATRMDWTDLIPEVTTMALHHDTHEAILGDIPTPTKRRLAGMGVGAQVDKLQRECDHITPEDADVGELAEIIVGIADIIEAMWFLNNHAMGRHADVVSEKIRAIFAAKMDELLPVGLRPVVHGVINDLEDGDFVI